MPSAGVPGIVPVPGLPVHLTRETHVPVEGDGSVIRVGEDRQRPVFRIGGRLRIAEGPEPRDLVGAELRLGCGLPDGRADEVGRVNRGEEWPTPAATSTSRASPRQYRQLSVPLPRRMARRQLVRNHDGHGINRTVWTHLLRPDTSPGCDTALSLDMVRQRGPI